MFWSWNLRFLKLLHFLSLRELSCVSWRFAVEMEHPLVQFAGIFVIRNIPKVLITVGAYIVLRKLFMDIAN